MRPEVFDGARQSGSPAHRCRYVVQIAVELRVHFRRLRLQDGHVRTCNSDCQLEISSREDIITTRGLSTRPGGGGGGAGIKVILRRQKRCVVIVISHGGTCAISVDYHARPKSSSGIGPVQLTKLHLPKQRITVTLIRLFFVFFPLHCPFSIPFFFFFNETTRLLFRRLVFCIAPRPLAALFVN